MITKDDPRHAAATAVIEAMHAFWKLDRFGGAVRWIEDASGRVVVFTRGEYRDRMMAAVNGPTMPIEEFQHDVLQGSDDEQ